MLGRRTKQQDKKAASAPEGVKKPQREGDRVRVIPIGFLGIPGIPHYMKEGQ